MFDNTFKLLRASLIAWAWATKRNPNESITRKELNIVYTREQYDDDPMNVIISVPVDDCTSAHHYADIYTWAGVKWLLKQRTKN